MAIGTDIVPVPLTGLAANQLPVPRTAPPPLGGVMAGPVGCGHCYARCRPPADARRHARPWCCSPSCGSALPSIDFRCLAFCDDGPSEFDSVRVPTERVLAGNEAEDVAQNLELSNVLHGGSHGLKVKQFGARKHGQYRTAIQHYQRWYWIGPRVE